MIDDIQKFIASKALSENSRAAYFYDLQQFATAINGKLTKEKLALYEHSLADLKVSAKKRKISAVNQFLYYLYEIEKLERFYKISNKEPLPKTEVVPDLLDWSAFYEADRSAGHLIALLILELGLTPSEILQLKRADVDVTFGIIRLQKDGLVRILQIPQRLLLLLKDSLAGQGTFLFDKQGKAYSRQWLFNQLKAFLQEQGWADLSASSLRQQFILKQKKDGKTILEVSQLLGLKSPVTLEKYYKNGY